MARDVDISVGSETSGVAAGLAEVRNAVSKMRSDIVADLAAPISVAGVIAGMQAVINKGEEIHHQSERFGIDSQQLQTLSNAAKEDGVSMEEMGRAMNRLIISQQAAIDGNKKQVTAFNNLGISIDEIRGLNPQELMLRLADGVANAKDKTQAYADVADILGARFGTNLIPMLEKGSAAIREQAKSWQTLDDAEVAELHNLKIEEDRYLQSLSVLWAKVVTGWGYMFEMVAIKSKQMWVNLTGDADAVLGHANDMDKFFNKVAGLNPDGTPKKTAVNRGAIDSEGGGSRKGPDDTAGSESAASRLQKLYEENYQAQLTGEQKIVELLHKKWQLQDQLASDQRSKTNLDETDALEVQILETDKEIAKNKDELDKAQKKLNEDVAKARDDAEQDAVEQERSLAILQLHAKGHDELVEKLKVEWEYHDKMNDLAAKLDDAWVKLNAAYATGDKSLIDQAQQTVKILENTEKTVEAEEKLAADAAKKAADDKQKELERERLEAVQTGTAPEWMGQSGGTGIPTAGNAPLASATDEALLMSTDPYTGKVDQAALVRNRALQQIAFLHGSNGPWSVEQIAEQRRGLEAFQAGQAKLQQQAQAQQTQKEEGYLGLIAQGRGGVMNDEAWGKVAANLPNIAGFLPLDRQQNVMADARSFGSSELASSPDVMQIVSELEAIRAELSTGSGTSPAAVLSGSANDILAQIRDKLVTSPPAVLS